jgi:hypothetical protein
VVAYLVQTGALIVFLATPAALMLQLPFYDLALFSPVTLSVQFSEHGLVTTISALKSAIIARMLCPKLKHD